MSEAIRYEKDSDNIVVLTMDAPGQSANTMNETYKTSMDECIDRLEKEENLAGVVLTSAKKTFFAGGDLNELVKAMDAVRKDGQSRKIAFVDPENGEKVQTDMLFPNVTFSNIVGE